MFVDWHTKLTPRWQWAVFCIVVLGALFFLHHDGLQANFLADDYDWLRIAREDSTNGWLSTFTHSHGGNFYRPVVALGFHFDYAMWQYNPLGFHLHQLVLQLLLIFGVTLLVRRVTRSPWLGFATGALFAVHPAQHEVVTWLAGRPDLYAAMFSVWALVAFSTWLEQKKWHWLVVSAVAGLLGMLSKETAFVLPALAGLLAAPGLRHHTLTWKRASVGVALFVVLLSSVLIARGNVLTSAIGGYLVGGEQSGTNFTLENINRPFTSPFKFVNWDYALERYGDAGIVGLLARAYNHLEKGWALWGTLLLVVLVALWWRRRKTAAASLLIGGLLWSSIAFIPVYGLSGDIRSSLMGTRLLFFASIGYVAALVGALGLLDFQGRLWPTLRVVAVGIIFVCAAVLWRINVAPWRVASDRVGQVREAFAQQLPDVQSAQAQALFFRRLPGLYFGAYEYFGPRSVSEMVRSVVGGAQPAGYLVGSRAFADSPYCASPVPASSLQVLSWDATVKQFALAPVAAVQEGVSKVWDFQLGSMPAGWVASSLSIASTEGGVQFTPVEHGQYIESPSLEAFTGSAYRTLIVRFRLVGEGDFGRRRFRVDWRQNGSYSPGQYIRHAYDASDGSYSVRIPLCQYLPWALSDGVDQLRILPATSGAFVVEQVILSPDAP